ncbi:MAG: PQQ-binding-like beta-propeller repeat protein [Pirellulaceae bacterium]
MCSCCNSADWPGLRGPDGSGVSEETLTVTKDDANGPVIAWRANVGTGFSSFAVAAGKVLTIGNADNKDTVYCLYAKTGSVQWTFSYEAALDDRDFPGGPTSTPTIHEGRLFVLARSGDLFALTLESGKQLWHRQLVDATGIRIPGWGFGGSPRVYGDQLILSMGEAGVAVNQTDGEVVWQSDDKEAGYASPVLFQWNNSTSVLVPSGRSFSAVDATTGKMAWQQRWLTSFGCNAADPIVHDGHVFLSSGYNRGSALLRMTAGEPEVVWKSKEMQTQLNGCILLDGALYGVDGDIEDQPRLKCIDMWTGDVLWTDDRFSAGAIAMTKQHLILLTTDGTLVIAAAGKESFEPIVELPVLSGPCWTVPVLSNGSIYCRDATGSVACVRF